MKSMTKGALAIGIGAAMLLGGGGTLATWNAAADVAPGTITAGDLNLGTTKTGTWSTAAGAPIDIATYRAVPGDVLVFTQDINVTLTGDQLKAKLEMSNAAAVNKFTGSAMPTVTYTQNGKAVDPALLTKDNSGVITAKGTFIFNPKTEGRADANMTLALNKVGFTLTQVVS